jgi:NAD(P)-dependent dehydrogenase (short-subunit alcohol dehydrogenase family)
VPTALITGASTGIGRATALTLARAGWTVFAGVRDPRAGEQLQADAGGDAERVIPVTLDVTDAAQIAAAAELVEQRAGAAGLDALVNNAGIGVGGPLELVEIADLRRQFEVNVIAQIAVTQALLPALRRARGRIVLVSSVGGRVPLPFSAPYTSSKHALESLGDSLRIELRRSGVQVALVAPGSVATPIWDKASAEFGDIVVPPSLQHDYGHVAAAMAKAVRNTASRAIPTERVAGTIAQALGSKRMRSRYLLGLDAHAMVWMRRLLPDPIYDRVIARTLGV